MELTKVGALEQATLLESCNAAGPHVHFRCTAVCDGGVQRRTRVVVQRRALGCPRVWQKAQRQKMAEASDTGPDRRISRRAWVLGGPLGSPRVRGHPNKSN